MELFIYGALGVLLLIFIILFLRQKKNNNQILEDIKENKIKELNQLYKKTEDSLKEEYNRKEQELQEEYKTRVDNLYNNYLTQKNYYDNITKNLDENFQKYRDTERERIKQDLKNCYTNEKLKEQIKIEKEIQELHQQFIEKKQALNNQFNLEKEDLEEQLKEIQDITTDASLEYCEILDTLDDFRRRREVVNQQVLREKQIQEEKDFYRICLSQNDIEDLQIIKDIEHKFNNKEVLHKAAFDCYVRRPLSEMEKRVLGNKKPSGIYIITYIPTGEIYIGRSTDIANRWTEHVKSAFNLGTIAHSSLHTKMEEKGIWNFTFQILEEVSKEKLNEREKYWINVYGATMLMNQKQGG